MLVDDSVLLSQCVSTSNDILNVNVQIGKFSFRLILVYLDVSCNIRNNFIKREIDDALNSLQEEEKLLLLGDFNAHVGFLGRQDLDVNGRYILDLMERNLILLNGDDKCLGEATRVENDIASTIDFLLVNDRLYDCFKKMEIDEDKLRYDLSDHCLISADFQINTQQSKKKNKEIVKVEYYSIDEQYSEQFVTGVEERISHLVGGNGELDWSKMEVILKYEAEDKLKKSYTKSRDSDNNREDPPWFTKAIEDAIKERRRLNRLRRNATNDDQKARYWIDYKNQKLKVADMVRDSISKYEEKITKEIIGSKDIKKKWKYINKLRKGNVNNDTSLYRESGEEITNDHELSEYIVEFWKTVYCQHDKPIYQTWNDHEKRLYAVRLNEEPQERINLNNFSPLDQELVNWVGGLLDRITSGRRLNQNQDLNGNAIATDKIGGIIKMDNVLITVEEVKNYLKQMKMGTQAGNDGIRPEIYRWLEGSALIMRAITECMNELLTSGVVPNSWKTSKTVLIPKKRKPKCHELRPISLNNISYKISMGIVKNKLYEHLKVNNCILDLQSGFTQNRRIEDNLLVLRYCVSESRASKKPLFLVAIDFAKAFDSIDRCKIVEILMKYKCNPSIIELIAKVYSGDKVDLWFQNKNVGAIEVTSGIRQGCTVSPWIFVMIMNEIIEALMMTKTGFRNEKFRIPVLMFADDGLLMAQTIGDTRKLIKAVNEVARVLGMKINKEKSVIVTINCLQDVDNVEGIGTADSMKYLGVRIGKHRDCFKSHKENKLKDCRKLSNLTYSIIARSCNKVEIGKTYWSSVALTSVLFGSAVITWTKSELDELQREENKVWRAILGAPGYVALAAMRGDLGASTMRIRDMKTKLKYTRTVIRGDVGKLTRDVFLDMFDKEKDKLPTVIMSYMDNIGLRNLDELKNMSEYGLVTKINEYDENEWKVEITGMSTLNVYGEFKNQIKQENFYDNRWESVLLFRARSNSLALGWRKRFLGGNTQCILCDSQVEETLGHFLQACPYFNDTRSEHNMSDKSISQILLFIDGCQPESSKRYLNAMWRKRKNRLRVLEGD